MVNLQLKDRENIVERKIRYDSTIEEYQCKLLQSDKRKITLLHQVEKSFEMRKGKQKLVIPKGTYTFAYYWLDQPYNLYFWRDATGKYLGAYFNIVRKNWFQNDMVIYEDLIIDIVVKPNQMYYILDQEELPQPIETFEKGFVQKALQQLLKQKDGILAEVSRETADLFRL
ncbi:hypothetical protein ABW02_06160 [Niallia circulans]|uniref:DUF402 domain-containing protein n=1 Tax=Niallia circulans TaxID=1397 RepID=A0A0J1IMA2_NIACI|nr:DUF402 domain-containing protein [Niallia circulans]KLV27111.1 hypothetical protein ABW02_06160 [Niallia circulans]